MKHSLSDHRPDHHEDFSDAFDDLLANNKKFAGGLISTASTG